MDIDAAACTCEPASAPASPGKICHAVFSRRDFVDHKLRARRQHHLVLARDRAVVLGVDPGDGNDLLRAGAISYHLKKKRRRGFENIKRHVIDEFIIAHYCAGCEAYVALDTAVECGFDVLDCPHRVGPESPDCIVQVICLSHCATAVDFVLF